MQKILKKLELISFLVLIFTSLFLTLFFYDSLLIYKVLVFPTSLIISEIIIRIILFIVCGYNYVYKVFPYYIIEDKKCGYKFKSNIDSEKLNFPIFERYAFPSNITPSVSTKINKFERVNFTTDENGLRKNSNLIKDNSKKRITIICSGGSTTAGQGIKDSDTWPSNLERALLSKGINCSVKNAGIYGYDSFNELMNIKNNLIHLKPDILILHQGWNEEFAFSVSGNKKNYKPKQAKKYLEKLLFYSNNIKFFPRASMLAVILFRAFRVNYLFKWEKGRMNFRNSQRWTNLQNDIYIKAWFDNLLAIKEICLKNNIKLFLLNYPCLVNINDSPRNREIYIENSRLTGNHAAYQAFSKARIEETFRIIENYFDILNVEKSFKSITGEKRLEFFSDEIHLSAKGENLLAKDLCDEIINFYSTESTKNFELSIKKELKISKSSALNLRSIVGNNSIMLGILIRKYIYGKKDLSSKNKNIVIPTDIYTTT